jgi:hypothetical protein
MHHNLPVDDECAGGSAALRAPQGGSTCALPTGSSSIECVSGSVDWQHDSTKRWYTLEVGIHQVIVREVMPAVWIAMLVLNVRTIGFKTFDCLRDAKAWGEAQRALLTSEGADHNPAEHDLAAPA